MAVTPGKARDQRRGRFRHAVAIVMRTREQHLGHTLKRRRLGRGGIATLAGSGGLRALHQTVAQYAAARKPIGRER